jgi:hypothetical protein
MRAQGRGDTLVGPKSFKRRDGRGSGLQLQDDRHCPSSWKKVHRLVEGFPERAPQPHEPAVVVAAVPLKLVVSDLKPELDG